MKFRVLALIFCLLLVLPVAVLAGSIEAGSGTDITVKMGDAAGTNKVSFTDSGEVEVASINSNGVADFAQDYDAIEFVINGGGSALSTGIQAGCIRVPYNCTIVGAYLYLDQSSTTTVDIWVDTTGNYPPTDADSICDTVRLSTSAGTTDSDTTLTSWTTSLSAGDVIYYNVDANDNATWGTVALDVEK